MKLIISQYIRTLKERDEFDKLLPDLLFAMGYIPISKPQTGVRQFGVDLAVVGKNPEDQIEELLLLVIKYGDIGRADWDAGPQSVRASLNETLDVYLKTHVEPAHKALRKKIIFATTGDLKQDTQINWDSYTKENSSRAELEFWGGDKTASLIEQYMFDEHIFDSESRTHLRRSLALAGTFDYDQKDLYRLFLKQLGLDNRGQRTKKISQKALIKALRAINLSTQIYAKWSEQEGNLKQSLIAAERAILWSWHRIQLENKRSQKKFYPEISELFVAYNKLAFQYFEKLQQHIHLKDGLSGYTRESAAFSLIVFEQVGFIATIGLAEILVSHTDESTRQTRYQNAVVVAQSLISLIRNNPISGSPALDINVIDIVLGLLLLWLTGHKNEAEEWLENLIKRVDYTYKCKRNFPICTDSLDDLVDVSVFGDEELKNRLMKTSWILPTLAGWSAILEREDSYHALSNNTKNNYPEICLQLWHPTVDVFNFIYFEQAQHECGEAEAPIILPDSFSKFNEMMNQLIDSERYNVVDSSPAANAGIPVLDLIACRHFKTPVAPYFWYRLINAYLTTPAANIQS